MRAAACLGLALAILASPRPLRAQSIFHDTDRIDITGRQNLTLGSGARAYGMGGAFLARADDATAASWNPAGLSYLRLPEVSLVGASSLFDITRGQSTDHFNGRTIDFGAFTWPVRVGGAHGAVQLSYQRAVSFDGRRRILFYDDQGQTSITEDVRSSGGFDVVALGAGLRLTRSLRAGATLNRWLNGYTQTLSRDYLQPTNRRPKRYFELDFQPRGWNANLGLMWSPLESLNVGAVFKTPFRAGVELAKSRLDPWLQATGPEIEEITTNSYSTSKTRLDFPASYGFGLSWRPHDTFTLSADLTLTRWSQARIHNYFDLEVTPAGGETPAPKPPPNVYPLLQYPTLNALPTSDNPGLSTQQDKQELRVGMEYVLIAGRLKVPLRAGYFNDRQITQDLVGHTPRFDGFTAGVGLVLGSVLLDVAYVYEFGKYYVAGEAADAPDGPDSGVATAPPTQRNSLTTNRVFASVIYRFSGRP
ncbi:MAG: OmpP1/FadL family transporter [Betaproteobacteria bacterium]